MPFDPEVEAAWSRADRPNRQAFERVVLVTGSSGRLGSRICAELQSRFTVRGLDIRPGPVTTIVADLLDRSARQEAVAGAWSVVHVAALHAPHVGVVPDQQFRAVNVDATEALLADAAAAGVDRVVYTSSTSVYGHALEPTGATAVWVDERLEPLPRDIYDETKLAAEALVTAVPIPAAVLHVARCFPEPAPTMASHRLHRGAAAQDVAAAHLLAVDDPGVTGIFNVGGPVLFRPEDTAALWRDAPALIRRRFPEIAAHFARRAWPLPERLDRVYDSRLASLRFGYQPVRGVFDVG